MKQAAIDAENMSLPPTRYDSYVRRELCSIRQKSGAAFMYEASVAGTIPVIRVIQILL